MIKVIIFDADGVLIHNKKKFSILLAEKYGIPLEKTLPFFNGPFQDCLIGNADLKKTLSSYLSTWGWSKGVDNFLDLWFQTEHNINEELIQYVQKLRQKEILCFLATNNEKYRFQYILDKMGFANSFDKAYASAHLGHKKPEISFFSKILKELKDVKKDEILFVDDSIENVKGALEFGIHTELYVSMDSLKDKLAVLN